MVKFTLKKLRVWGCLSIPNLDSYFQNHFFGSLKSRPSPTAQYRVEEEGSDLYIAFVAFHSKHSQSRLIPSDQIKDQSVPEIRNYWVMANHQRISGLGNNVPGLARIYVGRCLRYSTTHLREELRAWKLDVARNLTGLHIYPMPYKIPLPTQRLNTSVHQWRTWNWIKTPSEQNKIKRYFLNLWTRFSWICCGICF